MFVVARRHGAENLKNVKGCSFNIEKVGFFCKILIKYSVCVNNAVCVQDGRNVTEKKGCEQLCALSKLKIHLCQIESGE